MTGRTPMKAGQPGRERVTWQLRERIKELTALHRAARVLQAQGIVPSRALARVARSLPRAWQHPRQTVVRIRYGDQLFTSDGYRRPRRTCRVRYRTRGRRDVVLEVGVIGRPPPGSPGPFLREELLLQRSLAKLLVSYLDRHEAEQRLKQYYATLEDTVAERTAELKLLNRDLRREAAQRKRREHQIGRYQRQLRELSSELLQAEESERKRIAAVLHDRIGQSLALMRLSLDEYHARSHSGPAREWAEEFRRLLDESIRHARALTNEISPPLLYEIGLGPALEWLGEHYQELFGYRVVVRCRGSTRPADGRIEFVAYMAARELLMNAAKHARATQVAVDVQVSRQALAVAVRDDGAGFDPARIGRTSYGLFNIREQVRRFRGSVDIESRPGHGARIRITMRCARTAPEGGGRG